MKSKWNSKKDSKKFNLKTINEEITLKTIKRMHRKKTACSDGLTQELLKLGSSALAAPLTAIINKSILTSTFPEYFKLNYNAQSLKQVLNLSCSHYICVISFDMYMGSET